MFGHERHAVRAPSGAVAAIDKQSLTQLEAGRGAEIYVVSNGFPPCFEHFAEFDNLAIDLNEPLDTIENPFDVLLVSRIERGNPGGACEQSFIPAASSSKACVMGSWCLNASTRSAADHRPSYPQSPGVLARLRLFYRVHREQRLDPLRITAASVLPKERKGRPILFAHEVLGALWDCAVEIGKVDSRS